jgi:hypothetical protein
VFLSWKDGTILSEERYKFSEIVTSHILRDYQAPLAVKSKKCYQITERIQRIPFALGVMNSV